MSSHHIVREKQEPALMIANGEECNSELLEQLLEWSPTVLVLDGAIERVVAKGIKVDILLGDFDSNIIDMDVLKETQYPIKIIHTPDQDKTDLEKGIEYLIQLGYPAVNIVWATGKRMDHTFANISNIVKYKEAIKIVMIDNHSKIIPLLPLPAFFQKWHTANTSLSLIPLPCAEGIKTTNLKYPLQDESLQLLGRMGNSNSVKEDGLVQIEFLSGNLLLMECLD
jgi:thiamine pyrophosphokinase